ncbi:hypothetical protein FOZ62_010472, partial [Perkinsus olseni]
CSASGKAGGFLARGWCSSGPTRQLHYRGFDLIRQYAQQHRLESYRDLPTAQTEIHRSKRRKSDGQCSWLDKGTTQSSLMDSETAQITPLELTESLIAEATNLGMLELRTGAKVVDVVIKKDGKAVTGVVLDDGCVVPGSEVILAMGAWSCEVEAWPALQGKVRMPMSGIKSSSLVYRDTRMPAVPDPHALFWYSPHQRPWVPLQSISSDDANGCHLEVYPRPDGDIYICGLGGSPLLRPEDLRSLNPSDVQPELSRAAAGHKSLSTMTSLIDSGKGPDIKQACLRPILPDALP